MMNHAEYVMITNRWFRMVNNEIEYNWVDYNDEKNGEYHDHEIS